MAPRRRQCPATPLRATRRLQPRQAAPGARDHAEHACSITPTKHGYCAWHIVPTQALCVNVERGCRGTDAMVRSSSVSIEFDFCIRGKDDKWASGRCSAEGVWAGRSHISPRTRWATGRTRLLGLTLLAALRLGRLVPLGALATRRAGSRLQLSRPRRAQLRRRGRWSRARSRGCTRLPARWLRR